MLSTEGAPNLLDKKIQKVYIKDNKRKMITDTGFMYIPADHARSLFGRHKGGKYSIKQNVETDL